MSNVGSNAMDGAVAIERIMSTDPSYQIRHYIANGLIATGFYTKYVIGLGRITVIKDKLCFGINTLG